MIKAEISHRTMSKSGVPWNVDAAEFAFEKLTTETKKTLYFYKNEGCSISKWDSPCLTLGIYSVGVSVGAGCLCLPLKPMESNGPF